MDTQITHRLVAEEQAKKQCQNLQRVRQANPSAQAPQSNRQHPLLRQASSKRYSGYYQAERNVVSNQIQRQTTTDRYPQDAQHILQRIEQEKKIQWDVIK